MYFDILKRGGKMNKRKPLKIIDKMKRAGKVLVISKY